MQLIPVLDLLDGNVVHAKRGDRRNYQPIDSLISSSSEPLHIVDAILRYYPFESLYVADLNAIQNRGNHNFAIIKDIMQQHPALSLWIDAGIRHLSALSLLHERNFNVILGSENFYALDMFTAVRDQFQNNVVLSLDFMPGGYRGPIELITNADYWPETVILMSLPHVGANQGPNIGLIEKFTGYSDKVKFYVAGGIRHMHDVYQLKDAGVFGALFASAIHSKQISPQELTHLKSETRPS